MASAAHWVFDITTAGNVIRGTLISGSGAAVVWTVLGQGDVAAVAGVVLVQTHITTFPPTIFSRTVADDLIIGIDGVGWTFLGTLAITCL